MPSVRKEDILKMAVKAVNETAGTYGLVPKLLVFVILLRLPAHPKDLPYQRKREQEIQLARREMARRKWPKNALRLH